MVRLFRLSGIHNCGDRSNTGYRLSIFSSTAAKDSASRMKYDRDMKAIILAGGTGSRLYPLTLVSSKQLQAVYDKPMIIRDGADAAGIREFCLITTPRDQPSFEELLGDGSQWGISIEIPRSRAGGNRSSFHHRGDVRGRRKRRADAGRQHLLRWRCVSTSDERVQDGASIFAYHVRDPQACRGGRIRRSRHRAVDRGKAGESEVQLCSSGACIFMTGGVVEIAKKMRPSKREIEITDINRAYLDMGQLQVRRLSRGFACRCRYQQHAAGGVRLHRNNRTPAGVKISCPRKQHLSAVS